jgi:uncharacterized membrane protein
MLTLLGVGVVVLGFLLRFNPLLVIGAAAFVTGWAADLPSAHGDLLHAVLASAIHTLSVLGKAFNQSRLVSVAFLVLPVIGVLERAGLQERARIAISKIRAATAGRLLLVYLFLRQVSVAFGLQINGQAAMVRPLIAPMAEAAAESPEGELDEKTKLRIRAYAAATDNVGAFFGEDIFIAIGSILLIKGMLDQSGFPVQPLELSLWAIPTAILAFAIHGARLLLLDRKLRETRP